MNNIRLETERLIVRPHGMDDFKAYFEYVMDPDLQAKLGLNGVSDEASARETFCWLMDHCIFLALVRKADGKAIGHIALHPPYDRLMEDAAFKGRNGYSLSFAIAREQQRKGLMWEALQALIQELFEHQGIEFLDAEAEPDNPASNALQEKLGFTLWGRDSFDDVELLIRVLTKEQWQATKKALW